MFNYQVNSLNIERCTFGIERFQFTIEEKTSVCKKTLNPTRLTTPASYPYPKKYRKEKIRF